jgi:hypothetical protein
MPSLAAGDLPYTPFVAQIIPAPYPNGECPQSPDDLKNWFSKFRVEFKPDRVAFAYTAGTRAAATVNDRTLPRLEFDEQGRFIGFNVWNVGLGSWTIGGTIGELKTIVRTATTLEDDLENKGFTGSGWHLCDGTQAGLPDLTANTGFFTGGGPNYTVYTVGYTGT